MQPEDEKARLTREWIEKAEHDLLAAQRAALPPALLDITVFHCQQAMEKVLKGFLTWHDQPFRRTHNLMELLAQCRAIDAAFAELEGSAALLSPYAADHRYPGSALTLDSHQAAIALRLAGEAVAFVATRLP